VAGKGSFVAQQDVELARESSLREIEQHLQAALELSRQIELPVSELQNILQVLSEEE
jgi:GntR family transcriptional regulator